MNKYEKLKKESKINIGIYAIKITLYNNLGKPVDLNPKMFVFSDGSSLTMDLNSHPFLSTNIKYNIRKLDKLTHQECIKTFFNKRTFINFLRDEPFINDDKDENKTIQNNVQTMLEYIFPMSFPVIKIIKRKSAPTTLGFIKAFKKEFFKNKYNTFLNIGGKTNTVDGITILDTFSTNPVYIKVYEFIQKYKQQVIVAYEDIFDQLEKLHKQIFAAIGEINRAGKDNLTPHKEQPYIIRPGDNLEPVFINFFNTKFTFEKGSSNPISLYNIKNEMDFKMNQIKLNKLDQTNFQTKYKPLRTELRKYKDFLEETMKELFPDKKLYKEDELRKHYKKFYEDTYSKLLLFNNILKLIKVSEFLASISYLESYNKNISTYGIISSVDMKKFGFYKKMLDEMKDYYFPKRESLDKLVKDSFNTGEFGNEIDIVKIEEMYNNANQLVSVDVDKIDLNVEDRNAPRYNIQVQISIFGGMVSDGIKKFIKCKYEEQKLGADIGRYIVDSEQSEYFDLTSEIAKIEQKMKAQKKGKKITENNTNPKNDNPKNDNPMAANPLNNRIEQKEPQPIQEDIFKSSSKMTDQAQTKVSSLLVKLKEKSQTNNEDNKKKTEYEKNITYVTDKNAFLIDDEEFIKEFNSNPDIIKFINLSDDSEFDMIKNAQIEDNLNTEIQNSLELKKRKAQDARTYAENNPEEKTKAELNYTKYNLMLSVIAAIHKENGSKKGYNKAKTGGKKTRRMRRSHSLRRTRKH